MATNFKNSIYKYISGLQTLPVSSIKTGTVSTTGKNVVGSGTLFLSEMPKGSWLVDLVAGELRRVTSVASDTIATIDEPFTVNLAAASADIIHEDDTHVVTISVAIVAGAADGVVDGETLPNGQSLTFSKDSRDDSSVNDFVDPLIVDATGTNMLTLISR